MSLPIDFEKKVKLPDNEGYPYSIRAEDLMRNFSWCDLLPSDSGDEIRVEFDDVPGETARHRQRKIRVVGSGGSKHPWRVSLSLDDDGTRTVFDLAGGTIYGQGDPVLINQQTLTIPYGEYLWLAIERDESSRELASAAVGIGAALPVNTQTTQYRLIAENNNGEIIQYQFEEIRIHELLIVENGEFSLSGFEMSHRNTYQPPS